MSLIDTDMLNLRNGGRWHFWLAQIDVVKSYVDAHGKDLTRVRVAGQTTAAMTAEAGRVLIWDGTRGGIRMPHLHYAGEILLLDEKQWTDFSTKAMSALSSKLGGAKNVAFENVMHVSEVMAGM